MAVQNTAELATTFGLTSGVAIQQAPADHVVGSVLRTRVVNDASPINYGVPANLSAYSASGESFSISDHATRLDSDLAAGSVPIRPGRPARGSIDDPDVPQGRPEMLDSVFAAPPTPPVEPWEAPSPTDEQLRNPLNVIPSRPTTSCRSTVQRGA